MHLPLRVVPDCQGIQAEVRDADDNPVAFCPTPEQARELVAFANGRAGLKTENARLRYEVEELIRLLKEFNAGDPDWHRARRRLVGEAEARM